MRSEIEAKKGFEPFQKMRVVVRIEQILVSIEYGNTDIAAEFHTHKFNLKKELKNKLMLKDKTLKKGADLDQKVQEEFDESTDAF